MITASGVPTGIGLFIPPLYEVIISVVCLGIIGWTVYRKVVPSYLATLDERTAKIEGGLRRAEAAEAEIAEQRLAFERELEEAQAQAGQARDSAREDAKAIVADAQRTAREEAQRILDTAHAQIAADTKAAEIALRADVGALASQLAERIIGESLKDTALTGRVVDRFLDELAASTQPAKSR
jgi:F-type H+-transporting ATPase subunit b